MEVREGGMRDIPKVQAVGRWPRDTNVEEADAGGF